MVDVILKILRGVLVFGDGFDVELDSDGLHVYHDHLLVWYCRVSGDRVLVFGITRMEFLLSCPGLFVDLQGSVDEVCDRDTLGDMDYASWGFRSHSNGHKYGIISSRPL